MKNEFKTIVIIILFFSKLASAQSPWTKDKGKAYVQLGFSGLYYNKAQLDGEKVNLNANYSDVTLQAYSEYGITNKLEIQAILPYKVLASKNQTTLISRSFSGIGNITMGIKYRVFDKKVKISTGLLFTEKTSKYDDKSGLSTGFNARTILPYVSIGSSNDKWYYYGSLGYAYMDNDYSDYLKVGAEIGYNIIPKGYIMLVLETRNIISKEKAFKNDFKQSISYTDRQTYNAVGLKTNYEFTKDKFGVNFSIFGAFSNDNVPLAPSLNIGIYTKV